MGLLDASSPPWHDERFRVLVAELTKAYKTIEEIQHLLDWVEGFPSLEIPWNDLSVSIGRRWRNVIEVACSARKLRALVETAARDSTKKSYEEVLLGFLDEPKDLIMPNSPAHFSGPSGGAPRVQRHLHAVPEIGSTSASSLLVDVVSRWCTEVAPLDDRMSAARLALAKGALLSTLRELGAVLAKIRANLAVSPVGYDLRRQGYELLGGMERRHTALSTAIRELTTTTVNQLHQCSDELMDLAERMAGLGLDR